MSLQNQVNLSPAIAFAGQQVATPSASMVDSYAAGALGIFFGCGVFQGADIDTVVPGVTTSTIDKFVGFVVRDPFNENAPASGHTIDVGDTLPVARIGELFTVAHVPMLFTDTPYLIINDADPTNIGKLTNVNTAGSTLNVSSVVKLLGSTTVADSVIKISVLAK